MSLDPIFPGHEDLYEPSKIYLFGKPFKGLKYVREDLARSKFDAPPTGERIDMPPGITEETLIRDRFGPESGAQPPPTVTVIVDQDGDKPQEFKGTLEGTSVTIKSTDGPRKGEKVSGTLTFDDTNRNNIATQTNTPRLARIYSFSYGGHYYKLPCPLIYLVWGSGQNPIDDDQTAGLPQFQTLNTGLEGKGWRFASDIRVWKMDKNDKSMVIDMEIGDLDDILLNPIFQLHQNSPTSNELSSRAVAASRAVMNSRAVIASRAVMTSRAVMAGAHQE